MLLERIESTKQELDIIPKYLLKLHILLANTLVPIDRFLLDKISHVLFPLLKWNSIII